MSRNVIVKNIPLWNLKKGKPSNPVKQTPNGRFSLHKKKQISVPLTSY